MRLNITRIRPQDYGEYHCVSKNEMGIARAVFHLQGKCCERTFDLCYLLINRYSFLEKYRKKSIHNETIARCLKSYSLWCKTAR